ncbi:MAG TPA: M14 family metallopeptidase [Planctomycetaceae bacterium]|nr:M14 family metallopeptidase [Planctomycetaceae bacterium]
MAHSLNIREFSGQTDGPHLLITGGVHGDEFEPMAAIRRLIELFETKDESVAGFRGRVTLIPIVNEAAFLRGHRCAEDGLDLARTCPGRPDGSATERTAHALSEQIRQTDYYIDLHTGGTEYSVSPLSGYVLHQNPQVLDIQRRMAKAFNLPIIWGTAPNLEGRSLSVARDANVPAIYCEYLGGITIPKFVSSGGTTDRDMIDAMYQQKTGDRQGAIDDYVEGCLNVMGELDMIDGDPPVSRVEYVAEDPTPNSGHMQVCNPSPARGYFESAVNLGDAIEAGDLIGTVYGFHNEYSHSIDDLNRDEAYPIVSSQTGLVLTLRALPLISKGESVAVILDFEFLQPAP